MAESIIYVQATRTTILAAIAQVPQTMLNAHGGQSLMVRCGSVVLERIHKAFITKAAGGTDEAGERWAPLSPKTIAYGRGRTKAERAGSKRPSGGLTNTQNVRWWQVYRQQLARFKGDKGRAARFAWTVLKSEGAVTLYDKNKNQSALILRDTDKLLDSLDTSKQSSDAVFRTYRGEVVVGTSRTGATAHHRGIPGRLPQRRLWPEPRKWPSSWWRELLGEVRLGLVDTIVEQISRSGQ